MDRHNIPTFLSSFLNVDIKYTASTCYTVTQLGKDTIYAEYYFFTAKVNKCSFNFAVLEIIEKRN